MRIKQRFPPITRADLDKFEHETGITLPTEYRDFLLTNNGGRPEENLIDIPDVGEVVVSDFLGIQPGHDYDLAREIDKVEDRIPSGSLPIAEDPGGNLFLLSLTDGSKGAVFFWDHHNEPTDGGTDWSDFENIYKIRDSFGEFLAGLRPRRR